MDDSETEAMESEPVKRGPRPVKKETSSLSSYTEDALDKLLEEVLGNEDYERAAEIRDEMNRRKSD